MFLVYRVLCYYFSVVYVCFCGGVFVVVYNVGWGEVGVEGVRYREWIGVFDLCVCWVGGGEGEGGGGGVYWVVEGVGGEEYEEVEGGEGVDWGGEG